MTAWNSIGLISALGFAIERYRIAALIAVCTADIFPGNGKTVQNGIDSILLTCSWPAEAELALEGQDSQNQHYGSFMLSERSG